MSGLPCRIGVTLHGIEQADDTAYDENETEQCGEGGHAGSPSGWGILACIPRIRRLVQDPHITADFRTSIVSSIAVSTSSPAAVTNRTTALKI